MNAATGSNGTDDDAAALRVVVAEDSVLLREGVVRILEEGGFEVVGQCGTASDLMLKVRSYQPDLAIIDIRMPPTHTDEGLRAAQEIRERHPGTAVLVLSQYVESGYALELLADSAEGVGYLLKDRVSDVKDFTAAVKRVALGGTALDPEVVSPLGRPAPRRPDPLDELTPREREVLALMAEGRSNRGDRRAASRHRARGREAHHEHLRKAQPAGRHRRPPPRPRRPRLPPELARPTNTETILRPRSRTARSAEKQPFSQPQAPRSPPVMLALPRFPGARPPRGSPAAIADPEVRRPTPDRPAEPGARGAP